MLLEKLEVDGQLAWKHVDDDFGVQLGARDYLPGPLSVSATIETIDEDFQFTANVRFGF
jgi:hypothetical protein